MDAFHSRQMIWQADGLHVPARGRILRGHAARPAPRGRPGAAGHGPGEGSLGGGRPAFLRSHHVGAVLMAEEPQDEVRAMARVTGVTGIQRGSVVVFRLGMRPLSHRLLP